jgi:hypothetical protein
LGPFLMVGNVLKNITIKWGCILKLLTKICNTSYWNWKGRKSNCQNDSQSLNQCLEVFNRAYSHESVHFLGSQSKNSKPPSYLMLPNFN